MRLKVRSKRGLAAARGADEGRDLLLGNIEVDVLQRVELAVVEVQVAHRQLGGAGGSMVAVMIFP
jgi:hypothetical protein